MNPNRQYHFSVRATATISTLFFSFVLSFYLPQSSPAIAGARASLQLFTLFGTSSDAWGSRVGVPIGIFPILYLVAGFPVRRRTEFVRYIVIVGLARGQGRIDSRVDYDGR